MRESKRKKLAARGWKTLLALGASSRGLAAIIARR
jgi:hypothetical protein